MTIARSAQFDPKDPPWIHAISRCVRKAFLCGGRDGKYDHRRDWVEERLAYLATAFAVEIASYAVMSNHVHVVLRMCVEEAARWSAQEVARRWLLVYPHQYLSDGTPVPPSDETVARCARDAVWVAKRRVRLTELGWLMSALKTPIARRANKEDGCVGTFWEKRYTSVPLLDHAALVACMAYVDLNPVRARVTDRPERSTHTSVRQRVRARQRTRVVQRAREHAMTPAKAIALAEKAGVPAHEQNAVASNPEHGVWIAPLAVCKTGDVMRDGTGYTAEEYLALVDATGRVLRPGKRGAIPSNLAPLLARLDIQVEDWIATMIGWRSMNGGAVGGYAARQAEASRRGLGWVRTRCALFPRPAVNQRVA